MVGLTIGFIGGGARLLFAGPGPRGAMRTLANTMLTSAATFGFFLSIGSVSGRALCGPAEISG